MKARIIPLMLVLFLLVCTLLTSAVIWSPQGNISLKDRYYITNDPIGSCDPGYAVTGKTSSGYWVCELTGTGDIEGINTNGLYLTGGCSSGTCSLLVNETNLNFTIDDRDSDTTYSSGSNLTLTGTVFSINAAALQNWLGTIFQTITNALNITTTFGGEVSGTYDAIVLDHDALDDQYVELTDLPLVNGTLPHCDNVTGSDFDLCVNPDTDTTYSAGSNLTLTGTVFAVNATSLQNWLDTIYQTITNALNITTSFGGEVSGTYDALVLNDDALDDQYIELGDSFGGDVSGTYDTLAVTDSSHEHGWPNLTDYPSVCPAGTAITQLGDSVTCSDSWVDIDGDTMTGDLNLDYHILWEAIVWPSLYGANYANTLPAYYDLAYYGVERDVLNVTSNRALNEGDLDDLFTLDNTRTGWINVDINPTEIMINLTNDEHISKIDIIHSWRNSEMIDYTIDLYEDADDDDIYIWTNIADVTGNVDYVVSHHTNKWRVKVINITVTDAGDSDLDGYLQIGTIQLISALDGTGTGGLAVLGENTFYGNQDASGYNLTADWFKGNFNWTSEDDWNVFTGSTLTFNTSKLSANYYNATQSQLIAGSIEGGSLGSTQHQDGAYDGVTMNVSEASGSPGLDIRVNFTGVEDFSRGVMRYKSSNLVGDYPVRMLWNYDTSDWDTLSVFSESEDFVFVTQPIFNNAIYVRDNVIQMRVYKASNGNTNNHYYIDWVAMVGGYGVPSGQEVDPLSYHTDKNIDAGDYNISVDYINATYITNDTDSILISDILKAYLWETRELGGIPFTYSTQNVSIEGNEFHIGERIGGVGRVVLYDGLVKTVTILVPSLPAFGSWTLTLPENNGDSGQFLKTDGSGVTSWSADNVEGNASSICAGDTTYLSGEGNCNDISSVYAPDGYGDDWNKTYADGLYRNDSWDNFTGIPHATPSDGDVTHFSYADEIFDWVTANFQAIGNYFDQQLNITSDVVFDEVNVTNITIAGTGNGMKIYYNGSKYIYDTTGVGGCIGACS